MCEFDTSTAIDIQYSATLDAEWFLSGYSNTAFKVNYGKCLGSLLNANICSVMATVWGPHRSHCTNDILKRSLFRATHFLSNTHLSGSQGVLGVQNRALLTFVWCYVLVSMFPNVNSLQNTTYPRRVGALEICSVMGRFRLACSWSSLLQRHSETAWSNFDENPSSQEQGQILEQLLH